MISCCSTWNKVLLKEKWMKDFFRKVNYRYNGPFISAGRISQALWAMVCKNGRTQNRWTLDPQHHQATDIVRWRIKLSLVVIIVSWGLFYGSFTYTIKIIIHCITLRSTNLLVSESETLHKGYILCKVIVSLSLLLIISTLQFTYYI